MATRRLAFVRNACLHRLFCLRTRQREAQCWFIHLVNYLAHVLLGEQSPEGFVGALLGDFVKGRLDQHEGKWPEGIARGIRLHRAIDRFTDAHPVPRCSRNRFVPPRRRFAGIIVDICYDHFLCLAWSQFSRRPLGEFTDSVYQALSDHREILPPRLAAAAPRMIERNWLGSYCDLERMGRAIDGVSTRVRGGESMRGAVQDVRAVYSALEGDFHAFFPELASFAAQWKGCPVAECSAPDQGSG